MTFMQCGCCFQLVLWGKTKGSKEKKTLKRNKTSLKIIIPRHAFTLIFYNYFIVSS